MCKEIKHICSQCNLLKKSIEEKCGFMYCDNITGVLKFRDELHGRHYKELKDSPYTITATSICIKCYNTNKLKEQTVK